MPTCLRRFIVADRPVHPLRPATCASAGPDDGWLLQRQLPKQAARRVGCGSVTSFGSAEFDQRFAEESILQDQFFQKVVPVGVFDECAGVRNALSHPAGFILFGRNLAFDVLFRTGSAAGVSGTLAHEHAHQKQFDFGWQRPWENTVRTTELESDAFSGLYMGLTKGFEAAIIRGYFEALANSGDYYFNSPSHHGTPGDRVEAGLLGLLLANDMIQTKQSHTWLEVHDFFVDYILNMHAMSGAARPEPNLPSSGRMKVAPILRGCAEEMIQSCQGGLSRPANFVTSIRVDRISSRYGRTTENE